MLRKRILPPTWLCIALLVMAALHLLVPLKKLGLYPWSLLGLIPLAAGIVLNLIADAAFKAGNTTVKPFEASAALITHGVFRFTRNPMYLGFALILLGTALLLESLSAFLVVPAFVLFMHFRYILAEEVMLDELFQENWQSYTQRVRRWI